MIYKSIILCASLILATFTVKGQDLENRLGVKGGLNMTYFNVNQQNLGSYSTSETGFYGGIFAEFPIDHFLIIQPEALYISVGDFKFLNVPIYAKYEVAKNLHLMVGPSVNYFFDFFTNKVKIAGDISSSYDITNFLDAHVKFTLGFEELAPNGLFFGLGIQI